MTIDDSPIKRTLAAAYDALAPAYERAVVPVFRPVARRLLQLVDLRPGWQVLDAGTGTGLLALLGAPRVGKSGRIIGIDVSEKMLEIARQKAMQFGFTQCQFRVGDLESLDLPEEQFDACVSQFALHHTQPGKALGEIYRVLSPGGMLVVQEWADAPNTPNDVFFEVLSTYRSSTGTGALAYLREQFEHASDFRLEFATPEAMENLAKGAGFRKVEARLERHSLGVANADAFIDFVSAGPLVHAELGAMPEQIRTSFLSEARATMHAFETPRGFEWSYNVVALIAHK